jgi:predicted alpha/beta superfamily hydrolase
MVRQGMGFTNELESRHTFKLQTDRDNRIFNFSGGGDIFMKFLQSRVHRLVNVLKYRPTVKCQSDRENRNLNLSGKMNL